MRGEEFLKMTQTAQITMALIVIMVTLLYIAFKLAKKR